MTTSLFLPFFPVLCSFKTFWLFTLNNITWCHPFFFLKKIIFQKSCTFLSKLSWKACSFEDICFTYTGFIANKSSAKMLCGLIYPGSSFLNRIQVGRLEKPKTWQTRGMTRKPRCKYLRCRSWKTDKIKSEWGKPRLARFCSCFGALGAPAQGYVGGPGLLKPYS